MTEYFQTLFSYNHWANNLTAQALARIEDADESGSRILSHIMHAERLWLYRVTGKDTQDIDLWEIVPIILDRASNDNLTQEWVAFIKEQDGQDFTRKIPYYSTEGTYYESSLQEILHHVLNHASYHRGQILQLVKAAGGEVPSVDFIFFSRSKKEG